MSQSQSQCETCIAPLTKLDSGAEQNNILKHTIKIKKKIIVITYFVIFPLKRYGNGLKRDLNKVVDISRTFHTK